MPRSKKQLAPSSALRTPRYGNVSRDSSCRGSGSPLLVPFILGSPWSVFKRVPNVAVPRLSLTATTTCGLPGRAQDTCIVCQQFADALVTLPVHQLCAGSVRGKNAKNVILKNLLDTCFGALGWYVLGYGLAFGERANEFLGESSFALHDVPLRTYHNWMFQYAFAATATTIVSGAVAERTKFEAYLVYAFFLTSWVYPSVVHWIWAGEGWLTAFKVFRSDLFNGTGLIDFAGCGVVHMVGGLSGLAGAWMVGPRLGRFDVDGKPREIPGHSASLALLGVFILWFGWYGFNPGSALAIVGASDVAALCAVNTTLAASSGCISALTLSMLISYYVTGNLVWDVIGAGNGALAGLVSITASCSVVQPWAALVIGFIGGFVYVASSNFVLHVLKVDDPLDAIAVHAFCGMWGLVATGSFADAGLLELSYPLIKDDASNPIPRYYGWAVGGDGRLLVSAIVGIVVILGWVLIHMVPFFAFLKALGLLRVLPEQEHEGLDISHHGGSAYPKELIKAGSWGSQRSGAGDMKEMRAEMATMKEQMSQLHNFVMEAVDRGQLSVRRASSKSGFTLSDRG
eukprot:evm.model.scf_351.9 EVM.evm.TU.scf_351.9   scf_351:86824-94708(+)